MTNSIINSIWIKRKVLRWLLPAIAVLYNFSAVAQTRTIYLGPQMESRYQKLNYELQSDSIFTRAEFPGYPLYRCRAFGFELKEETNRLGIILEAKFTQTHSMPGEMIIGNDEDSVLIRFEARKRIVTHGRSATLSVINFFSKKEDKNKQEEPFDEVEQAGSSGWICREKDSLFFNITLRKKDPGCMTMGADTLYLQQAEEFRNAKNGKIKKMTGFVQGLKLMKGETCLAAIDHSEYPFAFYILEGLHLRERLAIIALFTMYSIRI